MTKIEARQLLLSEARVHKMLDYQADEFEQKLKNRSKNLEVGVLEAYELIKDELVHILAWVWGW